MKSLRGQLTVRLLLGGALLLGAAGAALHWQMRRALTGEFNASLRATAQSLAALTEEDRGRIKMEFAGDMMPQFASANGAEVFLLRTADGRELKRSASLGTALLPMRGGSPEAPDFFDTALADGRLLRCAGVRFTPREEHSQDTLKIEAVLVVGRDRKPLESTLSALRASLLLVGAGSLAVLAALVRWGVRGGLAPLDRLGERVAAVDATSLATRFAIDPMPAELRPIAARLNELLARLDSAFARERRFTATAAHEFRTPLTELRALAEVNLTTPSTEEERMESWRDALAATRRMESLAIGLLELARAENPACHPLRQLIPLAEAFADAWRPWAAHAARRSIVLAADIPDDFTTHSNPVMLGVILGNLCANATEHAPAGAPLRVRATRLTGELTLIFRNQAPDLTEADVPHLFERFWRKDTARSDSRHHGLGLALAAEFTKLLGGVLTARLDASRFLEFSLRLPDFPSAPSALAPSKLTDLRQTSTVS